MTFGFPGSDDIVVFITATESIEIALSMMLETRLCAEKTTTTTTEQQQKTKAKTGAFTKFYIKIYIFKSISLLSMAYPPSRIFK